MAHTGACWETYLIGQVEKVFPGSDIDVWEPKMVSGRREVEHIKETPPFSSSPVLCVS